VTTGKSLIPLERAQKITNQAFTALLESCQRLSVAGSMRRGKRFVGDIELLAVPLGTVQTDLFGAPAGTVSDLDGAIERMVEGPEWEWDRHQPRRGDRWKRLTYIPEGANVDLFVTTLRAFPANLIVRTGPAAFSAHVMSVARRRGWHFADGFLLHMHEPPCSKGPDCPMIRDFAEEWEIFEALEMPWRTPQAREGWK
jgi:DNA polymerase/3'-5' exonuclease PolX